MDFPPQLTFKVGGEEYGAPVLKVREIVAHDAITRLPAVAPWIRGVVNVRGQVLPVVDLAVKFGLASTERSPLSCIVVFELAVDGHETPVGAIVEEVCQVLEPGAGAVEPAPSFGSQIRVAFLAGVMRSGPRFVLFLDIDRVLAEDEILAVSALAEPTHVEEGAL